MLHELFMCLRKRNQTARPSKWTFASESVNYLRFVVRKGRISPQECTTEAIVKIGRPSCKKELRSFLGLESFYRKFVPSMADLSALVTDMLKNSPLDKLAWDEKRLQCFCSLKESLCSHLIIALPNLVKKFCLRTDASGVGIAALLLQYHDDMAMPISYASRRLLPRDPKYSTVERECLALV